MGWVEDCAWLQENVPPLVGVTLPALLQGMLACRNEAAALGEAMRGIEEDAGDLLEDLASVTDSRRALAERHGAALEDCTSGLALAVRHVLDELREAQLQMEEHVQEAERDFQALGAVVTHAAEMTRQQSQAEAGLADAAAAFEAVHGRVVQAISAASEAAELVTAQITAADVAIMGSVETVEARMEAIAESGPKHIDSLKDLLGPLADGLETDVDAAVARLADEAVLVIGELSEDPQTIGEALTEALGSVPEPANNVLQMLRAAAAELASARGDLGPAAAALTAEREALNVLVEIVQVTAAVLNTDWGTVTRP